jgi:hypothetical protein
VAVDRDQVAPVGVRDPWPEVARRRSTILLVAKRGFDPMVAGKNSVAGGSFKSRMQMS